jgi:rubrerythrin
MTMVRGTTLFICTHCGHKFIAADIEYLCTSLSVPQKCPKCESIRTRPVSIWGKIVNIKYKSVWEQIENK